MKSVNVRAANLRNGDVLNGCRIRAIHKYPYRLRGQSSHKEAKTGVLVVVPNPSGNKLDTLNFRGDRMVTIVRPLYNMKYRRKIRKVKDINNVS